jgi:hypothetical protein
MPLTSVDQGSRNPAMSVDELRDAYYHRIVHRRTVVGYNDSRDRHVAVEVVE